MNALVEEEMMMMMKRAKFRSLNWQELAIIYPESLAVSKTPKGENILM